MEEKKNRKGVIIGVSVAVAVILVIAAALSAGFLLGNSPEKRLKRGMMNMVQEMRAYKSPVSEEIDIAALNERMNSEPTRTDIDLSFTDPNASGSVKNIGIEVEALTDLRNKKAEYDIRVGTYGFNMEFGRLVAADNTLYISVPPVFRNEVYSLELTNLGRDFNGSAWSDLLDSKLPEDASYTLFDTGDAPGVLESIRTGEEFARLAKKYGESMKDATAYTAISQKKDFLPDVQTEKTISCGGVRLSVEKDAYNEMMENLKNDILASDFYRDFLTGYLESAASYDGDMSGLKADADALVEGMLSMRLEQDYVVDFYMDGKGRIVNISTPADIAVSSTETDIDAFAIDISFVGEERALDGIEGGLYVKLGGQVLYLGLSRRADVTDGLYSENLSVMLQDDIHDHDITFRYWNNRNNTDRSYDLLMSVETADTFMELDADGGFSDIVKGEGYTFRVDNAVLNVDGDDMVIMSGTIRIGPADGDIEVPQNATNLLEMSALEIQSMVYGAMKSFGR